MEYAHGAPSEHLNKTLALDSGGASKLLDKSTIFYSIILLLIHSK